MRTAFRVGAFLALGLTVAACTTTGSARDPISSPPSLTPVTKTGLTLEALPAPARPIDVAVYNIPDLTGANQQGSDFAEFSRAVTQGAAHILVDVLTKAGGGTWFEVAERTGIDNLLRERQIIETTQRAFQGKAAQGLPALRFAGVLIEGAIVGYDSDETTGGAGGRFLGIGGNVEHRRDVVTVALRAVSVSTGRVLTSVTTTKTIYSILVRGGTFRFVSVDELLEIEAGFSKNEPEQIATREALELAVISLIIEGAKSGQWTFADTAAGKAIINEYDQRFKAARLGT